MERGKAMRTKTKKPYPELARGVALAIKALRRKARQQPRTGWEVIALRDGVFQFQAFVRWDMGRSVAMSGKLGSEDRLPPDKSFPSTGALDALSRFDHPRWRKQA